MPYSDYIQQLKNKWIGQRVKYEGEFYTVIDVDYNGMLLIDKPARFTDTTAISQTQVVSETVEVCPYCGHENIYPNLDVVATGYVTECQECKNKIFLCDECSHAEDNPGQKCDWHATGCIGKCFRGTADNRPTVRFDSRTSSGNIFWILGAVSTALNEQRRIADYNTCRDRVMSSGSYAEALAIIREYVDLIDLDGEF